MADSQWTSARPQLTCQAPTVPQATWHLHHRVSVSCPSTPRASFAHPHWPHVRCVHHMWCLGQPGRRPGQCVHAAHLKGHKGLRIGRLGSCQARGNDEHHERQVGERHDCVEAAALARAQHQQAREKQAPAKRPPACACAFGCACMPAQMRWGAPTAAFSRTQTRTAEPLVHGYSSVLCSQQARAGLPVLPVLRGAR